MFKLARVHPKPAYTIAVRELAEFLYRSGDLSGRGEFSPASRALAGTRVHQRHQESRSAGYESEVLVRRSHETAAYSIEIRGRIDGLFESGHCLTIEEIKSVQRAAPLEPDPLHWRQLQLYGAMLLESRPAKEVELRLVYIPIEGGAASTFADIAEPHTLETLWRETIDLLLPWLAPENSRLLERNAAAESLQFPFEKFRDGQRRFSVAVYRAIRDRQRLFAESPTGTGKTISTLFPALKSFAGGRLRRIYYATAKRSGRRAAEQAIEQLRAAGARCRSITLAARDLSCIGPAKPCDPASCPFALGFYDRYRPALQEALQIEALGPEQIDSIARRHTLCPYALSIETSLWADAIICDFNHVFDPAASLKLHFESPDPCVILVDEAHNLVERAREMYSPSLSRAEFAAVRDLVSISAPSASAAIEQVIASIWSGSSSSLFDWNAAVPSTPPAVREADAVLESLPENFVQTLEQFLASAEQALVDSPGNESLAASGLRELYFRARQFHATIQQLDSNYAILDRREPNDATLRLFCLDPSESLRRRIAMADAAIFFSATFSPLDYFRRALGGEPDDPCVQVDSPFPPENLLVLVHDRIHTGFRSRESSIPAVAQTLRAFASHPGKYLAFFPSYSYLDAVLDAYVALSGAAPTRAQSPSMPEAERADFLRALSEGDSHLLGFALMGGIFGEGIDLPGNCLSGAAIVGIGLPQISFERDLIRNHFDSSLGQGFDYAYLFPGMNRVVQSAGRVIRSAGDRGVVLLIDTRFNQLRQRRLLPGWWKPCLARSENEITTKITAFRKSTPSPPPAPHTDPLRPSAAPE